ncbi:MAG: Phosphoribosyl-dephospho-CoA transferase [Candidatus Celerinatantimonas neptuna]|nr:MAG: Phosphoribosyl-dephospho-CoA transferase [Candidatus Celerinatantimonas neptuna]
MVAVTPHDLIWIDSLSDIKWSGHCESWISDIWQPHYPLVVRRDIQADGWIAAGVRGSLRSQRQACWVPATLVQKVVHPEDLVNQSLLELHPQKDMAPIRSLIALTRLSWPLPWGVTGSCGYALATGESVMHASSDLDLLVRAAIPPSFDWVANIANILESLPCRIDIQLETPNGGVALSEWSRKSGPVLVKSSGGPYLSSNPWQMKEK